MPIISEVDYPSGMPSVPAHSEEININGAGHQQPDSSTAAGLSSDLAGQDEVADDSGSDEVDIEPAEAQYMSAKRREQLMREAQSVWHMMTHLPKNPFCQICNECKAQKRQCRKGGGFGGRQPVVFGDCVTADHIVSRTDMSRSFQGHEKTLFCAMTGLQSILIAFLLQTRVLALLI